MLPNPVVAEAGVAGCQQAAAAYALGGAAAAAAGEAGAFAAGYGCGQYIDPGNGITYLTMLTGNEAAAGLLPYALFVNTDKGFVGTFQGFNLTETRWANNATLGAFPMPWLASEYFKI